MTPICALYISSRGSSCSAGGVWKVWAVAESAIRSVTLILMILVCVLLQLQTSLLLSGNCD